MQTNICLKKCKRILTKSAQLSFYPGSRSGTYVATIATQNGYVATIATQIRYVATIATQNGYVATLRDRRNFMRLCATEETLCDFARPKYGMLRLCATQVRYVATIVTQNGHVATLRDPEQICCDFVGPKKGMLRPSRHKMVMIRLCATEIFARLNKDMLRPSATQKRYVATTATQNGHVATQCDRNIYATSRDPKKICCDFPLNFSRNDYES